MEFVLSQATSSSLVELNTCSIDAIANLSKNILMGIIKGNDMNINADKHSSSLLRSLSTLLIEAARFNVKEDDLKSLLIEKNITSDRIAIICEFYSNNQSALSFHLQGIGIGGAQLVDISWRIDYSIRSKHAGRINEPTIFVTLKVMDDNNTIRNIDMVCNREELQYLIANVRDAIKEVDRVLK